MNDEKKGLTYKESGVDIDAQEEALEGISGLVKSTYTDGVISEMGSFGGLFEIPADKYENPVLISSVDGVGTKLKIAFRTGIHNTVGIDIVSHCVNDIIVQGAEPLFFMDYIATGELEPDTVKSIVEGISRGCKNAGISLLGGETAEMPDFYSEGEYDIVGSIVGIADKNCLMDGSGIEEDDVIYALPSNGIHTNGYSLVRKLVFERLDMEVDDHVEEFGRTLGEELLEPHRCYVEELTQIFKNELARGVAHITGGGMTDNIPRILPDGLDAKIDLKAWETPPVFKFIEQKGNVESSEMLRTFNMGIGLAIICPSGSGSELKSLTGDEIFKIGEIVKGEGEVNYVR